MKALASFICLLFLVLPLAGIAQDVEMADALRQSGKIYVVVAVIAVIFAGLAIYLFSLDKKISKIEKQSKKN
ncbi:CcmD family protein [Anseongella ginsenosidimutans]|uniref:CcmD family protein n=1 Tax=Anseongella ginsenosidimutans TaxID=496056 RepID=A0A4R3KTT9_9SPHI|nr:CcmD family protein [Anseongella ginsenosidimutans]TCS87225.1 CcmD family protein [Anseongella ginsenosidimutans]